MPFNRDELHNYFPKTKDRNKVLCFLYLFSIRTKDVMNRLHKKKLSEVDYVIFPSRLSKKCFGMKYQEYLKTLVEIGVLEGVDIGHNKFKDDVYAFRPMPSRIYHLVKDKAIRDKATNIYLKYVDNTSAHDYTAKVLKKNLKRTKYNGKDLPQVVHKCNFAGRYYHYLTNVKSSLRGRLTTIDGCETAELDIEQCQIKILEKLMGERAQALDFVKFMQQGDVLYEYIQDKCDLKTRGEAKQTAFKMLFGRCNSKASKMIYSMFPGLEDPMKQIKTVRDPGNPSRKIYSNLARMLQSYEVNMLQNLAFKLDYAGIPFLSIHDSIMVKKKDMDKAFEIFTEVANYFLDHPKIKVKINRTHKT